MKKTLIVCPNCKAQGNTKNIGLVLPNGDISIQRNYIYGRRDYTVVSGNEFNLTCSSCGEKVYIKKGGEYGTVPLGSIGTKWLYSQSFSYTFGTV